MGTITLENNLALPNNADCIDTLTCTKLMKAYMGMIHDDLRKVVTSGKGGKAKVVDFSFRYNLRL